VDRSLLKLAPRDTSMAWAANLDPAELYEAFIGFIAAGAAAAGEDVRGDVAEFERRAGLSLSKDLFGSLGRGTVVTTSGESLLLPALILSQAAKDGDRFEAALAKLVAQLNAAIKEDAPDGGAELRTTRYGDHAIRYLAMPGVPMPLAPCYTRVGDRIVFALTPIHLKDYLTFLDKGEPSILDNPGFQEIAKLAPPNASCVAYDNVGEQFLTLYRLFGPMLTMAQAIPGIPPGTDLANLPSARVVRRQMFGSVTYSYATEDTVVFECQSPFGVGMIAPAPAIVLLGLIGAWEERGEAIGPGGELMGPVAIVQHDARRARDADNLNQIGKGALIYLVGGDNRLYPGSLGDLFDKKVLADKALLVSPLDPNPPKLRNGLPCSYESVFDKYPDREFRLGFPPNQIMAWNRQPVAQGRRYVLFVDGHVELMDEAKFQQALKAVEEAVQKLPKRKVGGQL
jgi:prepilin-type processing-associated H-X9-DG protein